MATPKRINITLAFYFLLRYIPDIILYTYRSIALDKRSCARRSISSNIYDGLLLYSFLILFLKPY